jgi:hypothetical protein
MGGPTWTQTNPREQSREVKTQTTTGSLSDSRRSLSEPVAGYNSFVRNSEVEIHQVLDSGFGLNA